MKLNVEEKLRPTIQRLRVAGKFAEGMTLDKRACCDLAKTMEQMARYLDSLEEREELAEIARNHRRQWLREMGKCVLFLLGLGVFCYVVG